MIERLNYPQVGMFIIAWFVADIIFPSIIGICRRIGAVDRPHSYKSHSVAVAFLGGVGIYIAVAVAIFSTLRFMSFEANMPLFGILAGGLFVLLLGIIDDFKPISAVWKLVILVVAVFFLREFGIIVQIFPEPHGWMNVVLTLLWMAGVTSAMNSLDNMDGAAGGVSAIASFFMFYIAWRNALLTGIEHWAVLQMQLSYVSISVFGACLGFLRYNFMPARIYLGDNGSFFLGFVLAAMTVLGGWSLADPVKSFLIPCSLLVVPLYDITLSTVLRLRRGVVKSVREAIVYCGRDHLSHRLVALGFSRREAVLMLYLFTATGGCIAYFISRPDVSSTVYLSTAGVSILILVLVGFVLDKAPVYKAGEFPVEPVDHKGELRPPSSM